MQYTQISRRSAGGKIDWEKQYLTFIPVEDTVFSWAERATSGHLEYSLNGGQTWVTIANGESTPTITAGNKVMWRGDLKPVYNTSSVATNGGIGKFSATGNYHACGNTMSLLFYDNYYGSQLYGNDYRISFAGLFYQDTNILTAPLLPSTTLTERCYHSMFFGCTSLTVAPELLANTLVSYCYYSMFTRCTSLNYIKCLAISKSADRCTNGWLSDVASKGTFVKATGIEDWPTGASGIPTGWTVVDDNS